MYAKIFCQIFDSTLADDYITRHVFMDMLLLADCEGRVDMTFEAISRRTGIPLDQLRTAIEKLESADAHSRSPEHEGKRLVRLDNRGWGWQITNYAKYRDVRSELDRRRINSTEHYGGYVYFATDGIGEGDIKIGFSKNPWARVNELSSGSPNGCILLGQIKGGPDTESLWHERFKSQRKNSEWFERTSELMAAIEEACGPVATDVVTRSHRSTTPAIQRHIQKQRHKHKKKEKTSAVPAVTTEPPSETSKPPSEPEKKTDFAVFVEWWTEEFPKAHDGAKYVFQNAVDGSALKRLLGSLAIDQLKRIAAAAWKHRGEFNCKQAVTIAGLGSRINQIRDELNSLLKKPVSNESPAQEIRSLESERREKYPQLEAANEVCNQNFRTQEQLDKRKVLRERIRAIDARLAELRK